MTLEVLQSKEQIAQSRIELIQRGLSHITPPWRKVLRKLRLSKALKVGEQAKSWDVLRSTQFIEKNLEKNAAILDIGCFCSEILPSLNNLGFSNMTGVDLNPDISAMPYAEVINYSQQNFLHTNFADASFDAITSISVIEHGFDAPSLLAEMSRLLKPGGVFIASFDYWPEKIDTGDKTFFDMSWLIFSRDEVNDFIDQALEYGLKPAGKIQGSARERAISCEGFNYTFGWLVLEKNT